MLVTQAPLVEGYVRRGFETVREAFADNFARRGELGGACCVYHRGEKVVDLWGGIRNKQSGEPWEPDTMVIVYSATKGLAAMTLALAHSRGWLDYEERVCAYWPEFAQQGKDRITVRQLLAHQAGLFAFDEPVDRSVVADLDRLAGVMARQKPEWEPGSRQAYHALTLGFYEGELLRRLDQRVYARNLEVPSGGAVATARAIAQAYGVFATDGQALGIGRQTLDLLAAPAIPPVHGFHDECLKGEVQFSLGFMKPSEAWPFGSASSFGSPVAGGSLGFADPATRVGYGYVTSQMGTSLLGDPRDVALRHALDAALQSTAA
jgi:CubicO group peptidase (beta-lactamase class C family)